MKPNRVYVKTERTPEELEELKAVRDQYQTTRPTFDQLVAEGGEVVPLGEVFRLHAMFAQLKVERERQQLTLADVAEMTGIDQGALSRLENGRNDNPTFGTISRVAEALGKQVHYTLTDAPPDHHREAA